MQLRQGDVVTMTQSMLTEEEQEAAIRAAHRQKFLSHVEETFGVPIQTLIDHWKPEYVRAAMQDAANGYFDQDEIMECLTVLFYFRLRGIE